MRDLTSGQILFLDRCGKARGWCREMAEQANRMELPILAREWDYLGKCLESAIGNQERAFRDDTLLPPPPKEGEPSEHTD